MIFLIPLFECKKNLFYYVPQNYFIIFIDKNNQHIFIETAKICYILGISIVYYMMLQKTANPSGAHEFIPVFVEFVLLNFYFSVQCFADNCFGHCIACSSD